MTGSKRLLSVGFPLLLIVGTAVFLSFCLPAYLAKQADRRGSVPAALCAGAFNWRHIQLVRLRPGSCRVIGVTGDSLLSKGLLC